MQFLVRLLFATFLGKMVIYLSGNRASDIISEDNTLPRGRTYLLVGILMLTLFVTIVPSLPSTKVVARDGGTYNPADFVSKNILFDEAHTQDGSSIWAPGNASLFSSLLNENGYTSDTNFNESLDSGILSDYDILVVFFPQKAFTAGEISAIVSFVDAGGGLLLVGVNYGSSWGFTPSHLNPLSSTFGVIFNTDLVIVEASTFAEHNVTYGLTSIWTDAAHISGCSLNVTGPAESVITYQGTNLTAVAEYGLGRVVCVSSSGPFVKYREGAYSYGQSHMQFSLNTIDWLAGNPKRDVYIPEIFSITVGNGPALSPAEVEEYSLFVGLYHDHTTHSDGQGTPEDMLDVGLVRGMDFMVMTDHAHKNPTPIEGVTGGQAMDAIATSYNLDVHVTVGAEMSSMLHTTGFPLTENIWTDDRQVAVDEIHNQGGIAIFCHPGVSPNYAEGLLTMDSYGYDAIEVVNSNYFRGEGEFAYLWNFIGGNDHHSIEGVGKVGTAIFVLNPSGPNGQVSDSDIVDAVENRRVVVVDDASSFVLGDEIWVNRYLEILAEAKAAVTAGQIAIQAVKDAGNSISLSEQYLANAEIALEYWNPSRALKLVANATSNQALGLDYSITAPSSLQPDTDFDISVQFTNNHSYPVSFDAVVFRDYCVSFGSTSYVIEAPAEDSSYTLLDGHAEPNGVAIYNLYLMNFNTTGYLMPVMFRARNIIDNVTYVVHENEGVYDIDFSFFVGRLPSAFLRDVTLYYDDGSGEASVLMVKGWNTYDISLESFDPGSSITFHVNAKTIYSDSFDLSEQVINLPGGETTTTTPTTGPSTGPGQPIDPMLLVAVGGIGVVVVVVLVIVMKKRGT